MRERGNVLDARSPLSPSPPLQSLNLPLSNQKAGFPSGNPARALLFSCQAPATDANAGPPPTNLTTDSGAVLMDDGVAFAAPSSPEQPDAPWKITSRHTDLITWVNVVVRPIVDPRIGGQHGAGGGAVGRADAVQAVARLHRHCVAAAGAAR